MANRYTVTPSNFAGRFAQGQQQQAAFNENQENRPIRQRMAELGLEQAEQSVEMGQQEIDKGKLAEYAGEAFRGLQMSDGGRNQQALNQWADQAINRLQATDKEAAANLWAAKKDGTLPQLMMATIQESEKRGLLQVPKAAGAASQTSAITDSTKIRELRSTGDPQDAAQADLMERMLFEKKGGEGPTLAEKNEAALELERGKEKIKTDASKRRAYEEGTPEYYDRLADEARTKKTRAANYTMLNKLKGGVDLIDRIKSGTKGKTTGLTQFALKWIPGTENYDFEKSLDTMRSKLAIDSMLQLKAESPTGSTGFGQLSEKELEVIQSQIANVASSQSEEQFRQQIGILERHYKRAEALLRLEHMPATDDPDELASRARKLGMEEPDVQDVLFMAGYSDAPGDKPISEMSDAVLEQIASQGQ